MSPGWWQPLLSSNGSLPRDYNILGCLHPDISVDDLHNQQADLSQKYVQNLQCLLAADTLAKYRTWRLAVRLCKQTLFHSMPHQLFSVPSVFAMDIMHLSVLNNPNLLLKLFTEKLDVCEPNTWDNWDWAFYQKPNYGKHMGRLSPELSHSFLYLLVMLLPILLKLSAPDSKHGNTSNIYMVWALHPFLIFCHRNTGSTFVSLCLVFVFSSVIQSLTKTWCTATNFQ